MCVRPGQSRTLALAAGILLAVAALWLLVLGSGSTQAAPRHHHHHRHHHHRAPPPIPKDFLGVLSGPTPFDSTDAAQIARTKIRTVRISLQWYRVQPRPGAFHWTTDTMVGRLAAKGISVLPTLSGTPSWIADKTTTAPVANTAAKVGWQAFVTATVRRYGPGGTFWASGPTGGKSPFHTLCGCNAPPIPITAWQIWNEPNLQHYFTPRPSPNAYGKLVKASRLAIQAVDSEAKVVLAGLSDNGESRNPGAAPFLKKLYHVPGIKSSFDAVAVHPYARNIRNLRAIMTRVRKVMKQRHDARTPLWVTEIGWGSGHPDRYGHNKGLRGQRKILQQSMKLFASKRKTWRVAHVYWFFWRDPPQSSSHNACSFCESAGLLKNDRRPKPAYKAYESLLERAR